MELISKTIVSSPYNGLNCEQNDKKIKYMNKFKIGFASLIIMFIFSSCAITDTEKNSGSMNLMPDRVEMHVSLDDYEMLGEMEVSIKYSRYFGLIKIIQSINEEPYERRNKQTMEVYGLEGIKIRNDLERALYKVHEKYPSGDFIVPVYTIEEKEKMFLGRRVKKRLKVKIYKTKS